MTESDFPAEGKVLSYVKLSINPQDMSEPMDLAMVEIEDGPQLVCWTKSLLSVDQRVKVRSQGRTWFCDAIGKEKEPTSDTT